MTDAKHAPCRVHVDWDKRADGAHQIVDETGHTVCFMASQGAVDQEAESAKFIARAWNSHDRLVEALQRLYDFAGTAYSEAMAHSCDEGRRRVSKEAGALPDAAAALTAAEKETA